MGRSFQRRAAGAHSGRRFTDRSYTSLAAIVMTPRHVRADLHDSHVAAKPGGHEYSPVMGLVRRLAPDALAALFAVSGLMHFVRPSAYADLIPPFLPSPDAMIAMSGIAELVCAVGLARQAPWAGPASATLLVAVFPANVWFALATADGRQPVWVTVGAWLRLPLQLPLIWAALQSRPLGLDRSRLGTRDS